MAKKQKLYQISSTGSQEYVKYVNDNPEEGTQKNRVKSTTKVFLDENAGNILTEDQAEQAWNKVCKLHGKASFGINITWVAKRCDSVKIFTQKTYTRNNSEE